MARLTRFEVRPTSNRSHGTRTRLDIWIASVHGDDLDTLDGREIERFESYRDPADAARFAAGARLVRHALGRLTGADPASVRVTRSCKFCQGYHGPPSLPGTELQISVSHSGGIAAVAVGRKESVGIDVEAVSEGVDPKVARRFLPADAAASTEEFTQHWVRAEAVGKAEGTGIGPGCARWRFSAAQGRRPVRRCRTEEGVASVLDFVPETGYRGAIAVGGLQMPRLRFHRTRPPR